ncbi:Adenylate kinase 2, chloroplastic [Capsicum chinense]|nr:Adenylate kinase 2, chloroplastic [Capsicum chinense]
MLGTTKEALQSQTHKRREESLRAGNIAPLAITWVIGIKRNYDLVHIAAEDLPRAEIAARSKNRMQAKKFMDKGKLVPDEIVMTMVKERLNGPDSQEKGWLLDGYPRSSSQAITLKEFGFQPDLRIHLEVPKEILVERVVGRRLDLITVKIYHLKYSSLETEEIESKLTQYFDDTEEKACSSSSLPDRKTMTLRCSFGFFSVLLGHRGLNKHVEAFADMKLLADRVESLIDHDFDLRSQVNFVQVASGKIGSF